MTHGHEDHIGALPYLLREINVPVYGTRLTLGLLEGKLKEHRLLRETRLKVVNPGNSVQIGKIKVDFIRVNHSIADTCALAIHTPLGPIIYASDFKFDQTPIDGEVADFHKLAELGDSKPGYWLCSRTVLMWKEKAILCQKVLSAIPLKRFLG